LNRDNSTRSGKDATILGAARLIHSMVKKRIM